MKALDRKLFRDLWSLKTQVLSIALVVACGIAGFIGSLSTLHSLTYSRDRYYATARFAHVFATAKRAPASVLEKLRALPGVTEVEVRVVRDTQLSLPGVIPPMMARLIGRDFAAPAGINRLTLASGRWPQPGSRTEAVVNPRFMEAQRLALGDRVSVLLNGKREQLTLVGIALSPEYIYASRGGAMPDDEWFAILWMDARTLASAFGMEGAVNSVLLRLARGGSPQAAVEAVDRLLEPYGGYGAVGREDQVSHKILSQEISQQRVFGTVLPAIFLAVAAFILNVVLHRQVNTQRGEIAALKALGYEDRWIALHYLKFTAVIILLGVAIGIGLGVWMGHAMTRLYTDFFHFPEFHYAVTPWLVAAGGGAALAAASVGAVMAIRGVVRLRPAEALRPPAPASFRALLLERLGYAHVLSPAQRMIFRNLERRPLRALVTVLGITGSGAILIGGTFWGGAVDWFMDVQFNQAQRAQVLVGFAEPLPRSVVRDLARLPGVLQAEGSRAAPAILRAGNRRYRTALNGIPDDSKLLRMLHGDTTLAHPRPGGLVLTDRLAEWLDVRVGDRVFVELLEGRRAQDLMTVAATVSEMAGMNAWMRLDELNAFAGDDALVSAAGMRVDQRDEAALLERLKEIPAAAGVVVNRTLLETFRRTMAKNLLFFTSVLTAFAATIAVGVVYNNARIQLAERSWELASLRVLGLTRGEVSFLLLGELGLEIAVALPLGCIAGYGLAALLIALMPHEILAFPLLILPSTYVYTIGVMAAAAVASAAIVRRRIDRLDLVAVLKTRE